ncbi:MAG: hypothetical protein QXG97_07535 [Nitrososphaerota archaeon]
MKKSLSEVDFAELEGKSFELVTVVEMLCEVCEKPLNTREKFHRKVQFLGRAEYENLLNRARAYDRVEVDVAGAKIFLYTHDFPGDVHKECVDKL